MITWLIPSWNPANGASLAPGIEYSLESAYLYGLEGAGDVLRPGKSHLTWHQAGPGVLAPCPWRQQTELLAVRLAKAEARLEAILGD